MKPLEGPALGPELAPVGSLGGLSSRGTSQGPGAAPSPAAPCGSALPEDHLPGAHRGARVGSLAPFLPCKATESSV